jgi:hypothetical protein
MAHISVVIDKCPECEKPLDFHFLGLCSLLGSATTVCRWCHCEVSSGRAEWRQMTVAQRLWYLVATSLYAVIVGLFGGSTTELACNLWLGLPTAWDKPPDFRSSFFMAGFMVWGCFTLLLQGYRVIASIRRSETGQRKPSSGFWNLQTWVQGKCILLLLAIPAFAWLVSTISR